jgi:DNA-binding transcriptional MerR regulator
VLSSFTPMTEARYTIRELSKAAGISVASIKYYLREGLLPSGDLKAEHRAHYGAAHLDRLRAIRALREVGKLPIESIAGIFRAMDQGGSPFAVVASAMDAMSTRERSQSREMEQARDDIRRLLASMSVKTRPRSGAVLDLAAALVRLRQIWGDLPVEQLRPYANAARALAKLETEANREVFSGDTERLLRTAVLGTVLFEPILVSLRRVMHEDFAGATLRNLRHEKRSARKPGTR